MKFGREPMFKDCRNLTEEELDEMVLGIDKTLKKLEGRKYIKKPIKIKAVQLKDGETMPNWFLSGIMDGIIKKTDNKLRFLIGTLEGVMTAGEGDYVIQGIQGEIYPCKAYIFERIYKEVTEE